MAFKESLPRGPNRVVGVVRHIRARRAEVPVLWPQEPFSGLGLPQCVNATLVGSLTVVVACRVQWHVGVGQIMSEVGRGTVDAVHMRGRAVSGGPRPDHAPIGPFQFPRKNAHSSGRQRRIALEQEAFRLCPSCSPKLSWIRGKVVQIEVMPLRFQGVAVLPGIGGSGPADEVVRTWLPCAPKRTWQKAPRFAVDVAVRGESPGRPHAARQEHADQGGARKRLTRLWLQRIRGSFEPKNRSQAQESRCSCWA
jgi:hypothetical protein